MIIKPRDSKDRDFQILRLLAGRRSTGADARKKIDQEIRNIQSGIKGESEAAYEIEFHYGASKNLMIIHDLRLECDGRVAQIDHLLIDRMMNMYVCESKRFSEGVAVNDRGEFAAFYGSKPYGIGSPIEQNKRHMLVLKSLFARGGPVELPRRLGMAIQPSITGFILVSKNARISRPTKADPELDCIIKNDQLKSRITKDDAEVGTGTALVRISKIVGADTIEDLARDIARQHRPLQFDWAAKFGLAALTAEELAELGGVKGSPTITVPTAIAAAPVQAHVEPSVGPQVVFIAAKASRTARAAKPAVAGGEANPAPEAVAPAAALEKKSKLVCEACTAAVPYNVAKFCWFNKPKFGGNVYCMECQKTVVAG